LSHQDWPTVGTNICLPLFWVCGLSNGCQRWQDLYLNVAWYASQKFHTWTVLSPSTTSWKFCVHIFHYFFVSRPTREAEQRALQAQVCEDSAFVLFSRTAVCVLLTPFSICLLVSFQTPALFFFLSLMLHANYSTPSPPPPPPRNKVWWGGHRNNLVEFVEVSALCLLCVLINKCSLEPFMCLKYQRVTLTYSYQIFIVRFVNGL